MLIRWIFLVLYGSLVTVYGGGVLITGWWTLTGHCRGSPLLGADWDACLPVQDEQWITKKIGSGHCDAGTWKRVYP